MSVENPTKLSEVNQMRRYVAIVGGNHLHCMLVYTGVSHTHASAKLYAEARGSRLPTKAELMEYLEQTNYAGNVRGYGLVYVTDPDDQIFIGTTINAG